MVWFIKKNFHSHLMGIWLEFWHHGISMTSQFPPSQSLCCEVLTLPCVYWGADHTRGQRLVGSPRRCFHRRRCISLPCYKHWTVCSFLICQTYTGGIQNGLKDNCKDLGSCYIIFYVSPLLLKVWCWPVLHITVILMLIDKKIQGKMPGKKRLFFLFCKHIKKNPCSWY